MLTESEILVDEAAPTSGTLPKRDYILLPLLSLLTILFIFAGTEYFTRLIWAEQQDDPCFVNDPIAGSHFKPNCSSRAKNAEGPWVDYHYNECGYRSTASCGPKPPGTSRIVLMGSSVTQGLFVPYEDTFFARAERKLAQSSDHRTEFQNLGVQNSSPLYAYRRVGEALALKPNAVLFLLTPWDLEQKMDPKQLAERNSAGLDAAPAPAAAVQPSLLKRVQMTLTQSRTVLVAQHFLFQNEDTFTKLYLLYGDKADFLRSPLTPAWEKRFADFDVLIGDMADKFKQAGVPLILMAVPSRAEAVLLSAPHIPAGVDPFLFGERIQQIAEKHGLGYVDVMHRFSRIPQSEKLFYVVDGHITAEGQSVLGDAVAQTLRKY